MTPTRTLQRRTLLMAYLPQGIATMTGACSGKPRDNERQSLGTTESRSPPEQPLPDGNGNPVGGCCWYTSPGIGSATTTAIAPTSMSGTPKSWPASSPIPST